MTGCGGREKPTLPKEEKMEEELKMVEKENEFFIPIKHLLILIQKDGIILANYEKTTDEYLYEILSGNFILIEKYKGFFEDWVILSVEEALREQSTNMNGERTNIVLPTMIPQLMERVVSLEGRDGLYVKLSDLHQVQNFCKKDSKK